jgi:hypothetical protein
MSDPRRYGISILENYSDKSLYEIALIATQSVPEDFLLQNTTQLALGVEFLFTEEAFTWRSIEQDLAPAFREFPDTCFCVSVTDGEESGTDYRILFFNGKTVTQYPEIRYPDFRLNDFEYEASEKTALGSVEKNVEELISKTCNKIAASMIGEHDPELLGLLRQDLFGDIILESRQDA